MCGISGWFSREESGLQDKGKLREMMRLLAHRGPDADGTYFDHHVALGHTRLSIIDLESGQQPMTSSSARSVIVFNGEIYNYESLKSDCEKRGYQFRTHSDTEVILALYETQGVEAMGRLRGMFAFALWDHQINQGLLVRDPLGIKPLFWCADGVGNLAFASEAKAIFASGLCKPELEEGALHLLMNFRYLPGAHSMFSGIQQLGPGHVLSWRRDGKVRESVYRVKTLETGDGTLATIEDSVAHHMVADVEVGAYLSGGIDSATIVALARKHAGSKFQTFTLDIGDDPLESQNAARTAEILDVRNHVGSGAADSEASLKNMLWHLEVPKINAYQVFELASLASRHVKVCLSGLGGDEIFLGYNAHGIMNKARKVNRMVPRQFHLAAGRLARQLLSSLSPVPWGEGERAALMLRSLGDWPRVYGLLRNVWDSPSLRRQIYGPRLLDQQLPDAFDYVARNWPENPDPVIAMADYEISEKMVNDLLWQEDRLSMAHGLEVRVPFVDKNLFGLVGSMERTQRMPNGNLKGYLRGTVSRILPAEILERPKSGFQVDAATFYKKHLQVLAKEVLSPARVRNTGLFNPAFVQLVERLESRRGYRWHFFILYMMLMTHLWMEVFEVQ